MSLNDMATQCPPWLVEVVDVIQQEKVLLH